MKNAIIFMCSIFCFTMLSANVDVNPGGTTYTVDRFGSKVSAKTMKPTKNELNGDDSPGLKVRMK